MHPSLRKRLVFAMLVIFCVTWIVTAVISYLDGRYQMQELMDAELEQVAKMMLTVSNHELEEELISRGDNAVYPLEGVEFGQPPHRYESKLEFQVWIDGNQLALHSLNAPRAPLSKTSTGFSFSEVEGDEWRVYGLTDPRTQLTVYVGQHSSLRNQLTGNIALRMLTPLLVVAPFMALLTWLGVGTALRPLEAVARQVAGRHPYDLSPIDNPESPKEAKPLIDSLNTLFNRLETAFENTRRFTADAAHELRTPLAGLAVQNEVALLATDEKLRLIALGNMKSAIKHMTHLVQQLLTLARWDNQTFLSKFQQIDLSRVTEETAREFEQAAQERGIRLAVSIKTRPQMEGDETGLQLIARNIIDNAIRYTPRGGLVRVEVAETREHVILTISDTGSGIAPELREQVFRRFYRGVQHETPGTGLGLSIAQRCVQLHHGRIQLASSPEGGLTVTVQLPKTQNQQHELGLAVNR